MKVFDIEGFDVFVKTCRKIQHLNLGGIHIHNTEMSTQFCRILSDVKDLESLSISPCCCATMETEENSAIGVDCLRSGRKRSPPISIYNSGSQKKRRVGLQVKNTSEPVASTSSADPPDNTDISGSTGLENLTTKWQNITHFEMINAKLTHPVLHKGHNGLKPTPCSFSPCIQSHCVTDTDLCLLGRWKKLQYLHLAGLPGVRTGSFLLSIAENCTQLKQLHLAYVGLTGYCVYLNQLSQAFKHFNMLQDFRIEHGHLAVGNLFCRGVSSCSSLQRLCVVSENGSIEPAALHDLMESLSSLVVLQLFTGATKVLCKKVQKNLKERFQSERPALNVSVWPLFDQDSPFVINNIPTKHLEELTLFSSKICDRPPGWKW
ncbi:hypothetical protein KUTeg_008746 [Tegillarca granosa]|uniref:F-box/LRR-repeat protein 18 LRR domain-containing protein n=1 Tax=Tegillarca granosa TaxID=220873 RepID=A0ABQ9FD22_TEGGR|nr:hypothetical protein KUTeg_008746 [Tegillarca granosa]